MRFGKCDCQKSTTKNNGKETVDLSSVYLCKIEEIYVCMSFTKGQGRTFMFAWALLKGKEELLFLHELY